MNEIVRQVAALTKPRWKDQALGRGAQIRFIMDLQKVPPVAGNEAELRELLINLIFNAVDAIEQDGTITCRTFRRGSAVAVQISDNGVGMSEEVRLRCLEPFFSTKADHGTGLGLAMVFGIVRRHDAELEIESAPGAGTTVTLSFVPYEETEVPLRGNAGAPPVKPLRILVVDDEPSVREVLSAMLSDDSHEVETASDGREGFEKFRHGTWDLVMTDRAMPQMNGDQLAIAIKQLNPEMPVVLVTGFADVMQDVGDNPPAIDAVVRKPFNRNSLRAAIAQVVPCPGRDVSFAQYSKQLSLGSPVAFPPALP
jgi:CheY-like chemotaxis protein